MGRNPNWNNGWHFTNPHSWFAIGQPCLYISNVEKLYKKSPNHFG